MKKETNMRFLTLVVLLTFGLLLAGCSGSSEIDSAQSEPTVPVTVAPTTTTTIDLAAVQTYLEAIKASEWKAAFAYAEATKPKPVAAATKPQVAKPQATAKAQTSSSGPSNGFLACVRNRESRGNYSAYNPSGASGAYQFMPQTAVNTANHAGRPDLASKPVSQWSPADQDAMANHLYQWQGAAPWAGPGCG